MPFDYNQTIHQHTVVDEIQTVRFGSDVSCVALLWQIFAPHGEDRRLDVPQDFFYLQHEKEHDVGDKTSVYTDTR